MKVFSIEDVEMMSSTKFQALAPHGGRYKVRTFWEKDIEIPIYAIPPQQRVRAR